MNEHHIEVPKTARYFTLGDSIPVPVQVWFVCHGYRQLASRFLRRFQGLDDGTRTIVAPEGLSRFYVDPAPGRHGPEHRVGASWMTREDRLTEIGDYVRYLDTLAESVGSNATQHPRPEVVMLGFSQGVHTVARWVTLGRTRPRRVALWGAYLPDDLDMVAAARRLEGVDLILVRGTRDPTVNEAGHARQEDRLREAGIRFRSMTHDGGHEIDGGLLTEIAAAEGV